MYSTFADKKSNDAVFALGEGEGGGGVGFKSCEKFLLE
jgi:hypothetical protein